MKFFFKGQEMIKKIWVVHYFFSIPACIKALTVFNLSQGLSVGISNKLGKKEVSISKINVWLNENASACLFFSNIETKVFDF